VELVGLSTLVREFFTAEFPLMLRSFFSGYTAVMTSLRGFKHSHAFILVAVVLAGSASRLPAQNPTATPSATPTPAPTADPGPTPKPSLERHFFTNLLKDQYGIWTFPLRLRKDDLPWVLPLTGAAIVALNTDESTAHALGYDKTRLDISHAVSIGGTGYATAGTAIGIYAVGRATHNDRARETGLLAFEALVNTGIVTQVVKAVARRPRPLEDNGEGEFFTHGSSFFSGHSSSIWTLSAVINDEYGKRHHWVPYVVFGVATAVSLSRYTGQNHFLGDILLGGAVGYGIGHFVYLRHHDPDLDQQPSVVKPLTKLEKYFPNIEPVLNHRTHTYGAGLSWSF
jgi:membrane-associated phospholipid phosphatase